MPHRLPPQRIVFAGSSDFAVPALERLAKSGHELIAVLTQPDRPAGRGLRPRQSPVKQCAIAHRMEVLQPARLKGDVAACTALRERHPDLMIVVAYGLILPADVLAIPHRGCVNIHGSLLPRWRGAAPIQAAILAGDERTGVTIMQMDQGLDSGPIIAAEAVDIAPDATAGDLHERLAKLGAELLLAVLDDVLAGNAVPVPQPDAGVTYAAKIAKSDATICWTDPAVAIDRMIRAFNPWPVAQTAVDGAPLRCWAAQPLAQGMSGSAPGTVIGAGPEGIDVQTGEGAIRLTSVQMAGRRRISAGEFARGCALPGKVLGK
jgi:methionyl-tRNA formyltransferase